MVLRAAVKRQIDQRDVDGRHSNGKAVDLALEFRQHQTDGRRGAGLGRDHGHGRRAGAAQVRMIDVGQHLIVGVGVDGVHDAGEMPISSCSTLTSGARQLVVHEALEITVSVDFRTL